MALALGLVAVAAPSSATPSLAGPTGVILMPTALTLDKWEFDAAFDFWKVDSLAEDFTFRDLRGGVGLLSGADTGFELGVTVPDAPGIGLDNPYIHAKYRVPAILEGGAFAVGGVFSTDENHYSSIYLVGSSAIHSNFSLHYGLGTSVYGDPFGWAWYGGRRENGRADALYALFGAQVDYQAFTLNVDYNGSFMSYGISFFPESFFSVQAFILGDGDYERMLGLDHRLGLGGNVRF